MCKVKFKDSSEIIIDHGSTEFHLKIKVDRIEDLEKLLVKFTKDNLSEYEFRSMDGNITARYGDKKMDNAVISVDDDDKIKVDIRLLDLNKLELKVDELIAENERLKHELGK